MKVATKLENLKKEINSACINSNRNPNEIKIIAVTKYVSIERTLETVETGIIHLGENRDEGLIEKWEVLKNQPTWHFIGSLQTRKVKNIIHIADYIHSLDRLTLADEINKRATRPTKCFVQVNVSGEDSKHGISPIQVSSFIDSLKDYPNIIIEGLMTMAPFTDDEKTIRTCFRTLKLLQMEIVEKGWVHAPCRELSMGMSNDYKIAIEEGATMIRIGTALVGEEENEV
jgi:PLP dependent protein